MSAKDLPTIGIMVAGIESPIEDGTLAMDSPQLCPAEASIAAGNMGARNFHVASSRWSRRRALGTSSGWSDRPRYRWTRNHVADA